MRSENLAIMFTDISGFTQRTSEQTREENALLLELHEALLLPVVRTFNGHRVKSIGDAFMVTFRSPTDAVLCAMAIQDRLWEYNREVPERLRIEVRVAINLGEVRIVKGDVFGDPVNIAARVEGLAEAGEIFFTESVYLAMNKREAPAIDLGYQTLKGIPEPIRVYRVPRNATAVSADQQGIDAASGHPFGGRELARVKESGAKLHVARELAESLAQQLGRGGEKIALAGESVKFTAIGARRRLTGTVAAVVKPFRALASGYRGLSKRLGAWPLRAVIVLVLLAAAGGAWEVRETLRYDPYREPRTLIDEGAFATAIARLDELGKQKAFWSQPLFYFLRGRALFGRGQVDAAVDSYREATSRNHEFRSNAVVLRDLARAVARKHNVHAQKLLVDDIGPPAEEALLAELLENESVYRWTVVDAVEQLGGGARIPYGRVALADLETADTCARRKRAVQKLGEYREHAAVAPLEALKLSPDGKCVQPLLDQVLAQLKAATTTAAH